MTRIPSGVPEWLVAPPLWVQAVAVGVGVIVAIAVAVQLEREDWHVSLSTQREMQIILASILGITSATVLMLQSGGGYLASLALGTVLGYGLVLFVQLLPTRAWIRWTDDPSEQCLVGWWALFAVAFVVLFSLGQATFLLGLVTGLVAVTSMLWALYMTAVQHGEVQIESLQTDQR